MSIREDLKAFIDGELPAERALEVQRAIQSDPLLQQEVGFMKVLGQEIKSMAVSPVPLGADRALEAIRKPTWVGWLKSPLAWGTMAVAGIALVTFAIGRLGSSSYAETAATVASNVGMQGATSAQTPARNLDTRLDRDEAAVKGGVPDSEREKSESVPLYEGALRDEAKAYDAKAPSAQNRPRATTGNSPTSRRVIRTADLSVRVKEADTAQAEASRMATNLGGFVQSSSLSGDKASGVSAEVTLRVPEARFEQAMAKLRKLGEKTSENITGEDVTAQYADLQARVKVLRAEEESFLAMLRSTRKLGEVVALKDRISEIRQQIESQEAQRLALKDQSALATITVRFEERPQVKAMNEPPANWTEDTWATAYNALTAVGRFLGQVAIFLFVLAPIWVPAVVAVWWFNRRTRLA